LLLLFIVMISAGSAFAADDVALQADDLAADDAVVADTIDEASDEGNVYLTDELTLENNVLSEGELKETELFAENETFDIPDVLEGRVSYLIGLSSNDTPLSNKIITVNFAENDTNVTTNDIGVASYPIPDTYTTAGNYTMKIDFAGDDVYAPSSRTVTIELEEVETEINAIENMAYPRILVKPGYGYYPIELVRADESLFNISMPVSDKTVSIRFNEEEKEFTTDFLGIVGYVIPNETTSGIYEIEVTYAGGDGYIGSTFTTEIEVYDLETQITAFNASYPRPLVMEGYGYYPILLTTNTSIDINGSEIPIPVPLANRTIFVNFDGDMGQFTTDDFGYVNYTLPEDVAVGNHTVTILYDGEDGYKYSMIETNVEVYDVPTQIFALEDVSYPRPIVVAGYGYYPIALTTNLTVKIGNVSIPVDIPLGNKKVTVNCKGVEDDYITDEFGIINYTIPAEVNPGKGIITITYAGDEGFIGSEFSTNINVYDVPTQIIALEDVSYPRPVVLNGDGIYPIFLTTNMSVSVNSSSIPEEIAEWLLKYIDEIPIYIPLANQAVDIKIGNFADEFTTDSWGYVNFTLASDLAPGNYTIEISYAPDEDSGYIGTDFATNVEIYDVVTEIHAIDNMTYPRALVLNDLAYFPLALITETPVVINGTTIPVHLPLANRTVYVGLDDGELEKFTTDEVGVVLYTLPIEATTGSHTIVMVYAGEEGYIDSSLNVSVEIVDVDTQIFAIDMSYPTPLVASGLAYYPIGLATDIPVPIDLNYTIVITENFTIPIVINTTIPVDIPIANESVSVFFDGVESKVTTNEYGVTTFIIPEDATPGNYTVEIVFAGDDGYRDSKVVTNVEVFDIPTEITALGNLSYPTPLVASGLGYYPILLTTDLSITLNGTVVPIPIPLANETVTIEFNGFAEEYTTDDYGMVYYVIPKESSAGNYTMGISFAGENGYAPSELITDLEIYDLATAIIAPENVTFVASEVTSGEATFVMFLTTNTTIPIPLSNMTVLIDFNGNIEEYTTNLLGMVKCVIPEQAPAGNFTVYMTFNGADGYSATQAVTNVEIIGINTEIVAATNMTVLVRDLSDTEFNLTLVDENGNVLANKTVAVEFNGVISEYVTDENGNVFFTLTNGTPGTFTIDMYFKGVDNYTASHASTELTLVQAQSKIYLRNALYFVLQNKIVNVTLWNENNQPVVGKTVHITIGNLTWSGVTDETGTAHIRIGIGFGVHNATVHFDGDDEYAASNRSGFVRVIKETPSIMVRGDNQRFNVGDTKIVKVYLWDRTSKPLPVNSKVAVKVNGQTYIGFTDSQGIASIKIDINQAGTYNAELKYAGNSAYNGVSRGVKFVIR
jgi:hypothetical protein